MSTAGNGQIPDLRARSLAVLGKILVDPDRNIIDAANVSCENICVRNTIYTGHLCEKHAMKGVSVCGNLVVPDPYSLEAYEMCVHTICTDFIISNTTDVVTVLSNVDMVMNNIFGVNKIQVSNIYGYSPVTVDDDLVLKGNLIVTGNIFVKDTTQITFVGGPSANIGDVLTYSSNGWMPLVSIAGATGPIGPTGPQGIQGPIGPIGPTGPTGATGPQGPQGPIGATGPTGPIGATGPQGPQGPSGPQGIQGPAGPIGPAGSGTITTLNTLTSAVQSFAIGTSGTDFNIASAVSTHTFNLPSASGTNRGAVTNSTQTFAGDKTFNDNVSMGTANKKLLWAGPLIIGDSSSTASDTNSIAIGKGSTSNGTTSSIAIGRQANVSNLFSAGTKSVCIGYQAGTQLSTTVIIGPKCGGVGAPVYNFTASSRANVVIGYKSAQDLKCRFGNVVIGYSSGAQVGNAGEFPGYGTDPLGCNNVVIGTDVQTRSWDRGMVAIGWGARTGRNGGASYSVAIGRGAKCYHNAAIALGHNAQTVADNQIQLGSSNITSLRCQVGLTVLSDERDKCNVEPFFEGLEFITQLNPVKFNLDPRTNYPENEFVSDGSKCDPTPRVGFIAQEIKEIQANNNCEFLNVVLNEEIHQVTRGNVTGNIPTYMINMDNFIPILVNAFKDLNNIITQQSYTMEEQGNTIDNLISRVEALENLV